MMYEFPPDLAQRLTERMATGQYASQDDVLREAFAALDTQDTEVRAIQEGIDDMEAGRVRPVREFDREFRAQNNIPQNL
jgi:Arc/MetJ-type ribon-helix-helix transcriptional regulator